MILSYKYRLKPNKAQAVALNEMLGDFCDLYNAALEHRIGAYAKGTSISCYDQCRTLTAIRADNPNQGRWSYSAQQQVLRRLEKTFRSFFRRVKRGAKPGFPRFRAHERYHAANFDFGDGLTIRKNRKLRCVGVPGEIGVIWHRDMPNKPKAAIFTRNSGKWYITFNVEVEAEDKPSPRSVGIDLGLTSLAALSSGELIARPNFTKRNARKLKILQRSLARCKRGSNSRKKRKSTISALHSQIRNSRRDFLHKESRKIVNRFGRIAVEDLNISALAKSALAKDVNDASWGQLTLMLAYKAENAGCEFVKVDPRGTSQTCPECRKVTRKTLDERVHNCDCGCVLDRDVAAAKVVHFRAFNFWPGAGLGELSQRVAA